MSGPAPFCRSRKRTRATTRCMPNGASSPPRPLRASTRRAAAEGGEVAEFSGETRLFILPGYPFRAIDLLLTNFHLPRSTLLMLVAALAGLDRIKAAYAHAALSGYRFFSYGDACLIEAPPPFPPPLAGEGQGG